MPRSDGKVLDILAALSGDPKELDSSLHYDEEGSRLFEMIIEQPEYYPSRAERLILSDYAADMVDAIPHSRAGAGVLLELGATDDSKAGFFLDAGGTQLSTYMPVNIEPSVLIGLKHKLSHTRPGLRVEIICADFLAPLNVARIEGDETLITFFSGSTIGQLDETAATRLLARIREAVRSWPNSAFIVSCDACRDPARLLPAYNDAAGVQAAFNLNVLSHLNRIGDGDFDLAYFRHAACWNEQEGRMDFHLESLTDQSRRFAGRLLHFKAGELVRTGVSYKRTREAFGVLAAAGGWTLHRCWTDPERLFEIHLLVPAPSSENGVG